MTMQYVWAMGIILAYLLLCWCCLSGRRSQQEKETLLKPGAHHLLLAYASQSGQAERLARHFASCLESQRQVLLVPLNQLDEQIMSSTKLALFIASTYGEGEPPDNALRFQRRWLGRKNSAALSHLRFAVLALGDSSYSRFCAFGKALANGLNQQGAIPLFDTVMVDAMNSEHLALWWQQLEEQGLVENGGRAELGEAPFHAGLMGLQHCCNPGSLGDPVYHLAIAPPPGEQHWQAGDILQILPHNDPAAPLREYSIASIPEDGSIELLVRQCHKPDGRFGLGSGWLTQDAVPGSEIRLRIRHNPAFHAPAPDRPMILIGNGTGLAGLRAHLKARELAGAHRNALFFGERSREHDCFFLRDINAWQESGHLQDTHLAFSRDQVKKHYVQDLLREQTAFIRAWVDDGAVIYVCGSLEGMATGVDKALRSIFGNDRVEAMQLSGDYVRDVY